jgi:hypothetical protein
VNNVKVVNCPGYEDFKGEYMMSYKSVDSRGRLSVVYSQQYDEYLVIPMKYVFPL